MKRMLATSGLVTLGAIGGAVMMASLQSTAVDLPSPVSDDRSHSSVEVSKVVLDFLPDQTIEMKSKVYGTDAEGNRIEGTRSDAVATVPPSGSDQDPSAGITRYLDEQGKTTDSCNAPGRESLTACRQVIENLVGRCTQ